MVKQSDFSKTCRLCSKVYRIEKLVDIFSNRGVSLNLKHSVNSHLPIKVTDADDIMPKNICINCIRRLNATNEFFGTVIASDKLFKKLLNKKVEQKSNSISKQKQSDDGPITESNNEVQNLQVINKSEESSSPEKLQINSLPQGNTNPVEFSPMSSTEICGSERKSTEVNPANVKTSQIVYNGRSDDDNIVSLLTSNSNEVTTTHKVINEKNLSMNSVELVNRIDNKYVNIVPKASHVVLGNRNCNGNIVINVASNAISGKDHHQKLPIEVLCCPDCKETVKIFTLEERQLFFEYLKQHKCRKGTESDKAIRSFGKYKETYGSENIALEKREEVFETNDLPKSNNSSRKWPDGDLPADPGPDPTLYENIFEDEVRLDDDFHWPMPKRMRRLHKCTSCEFVTKSALRLNSHQKMHQSSDKKQISHSTSCKHCQKRFDTVNDAKKHERLAHITFGGKNSLCEYCGIMKPQKTLRDHVLKQHTVESEIEMQECHVCGKSFISPTSLYLHKKIHTVEKQHLCDLCGKAFKQRIAMRRHYMLHFPRAPPKFKCDICDKRVTTRGSLRLHMMRHTGEKPQECPECHMVMRHGLKHHMRLHSDEAPFKCVVCSADFKRRDYVRRHMRKHLKETEHRTLRCNVCEYVFDDIKNFLIHHQNIHSNEIFTQIKIYECKNCCMQFSDVLQYRDHQDICKTVEKGAIETSKVYVNETQSCIMISHNKPDGIEDFKDCLKNVVTDQSYPSVYCDYKETTRQKDMMEESIENNLGGPGFRSETNSATDKYQQNNFKFNEDSQRSKKQQEILQEHHVILSDDVMSLETESSAYSYINIIDKRNLREKDILMTVDEHMMTNNSVNVFEPSVVEQFSQSSHSHPQSHLAIHPHTENYTRQSLSWKQL